MSDSSIESDLPMTVAKASSVVIGIVLGAVVLNILAKSGAIPDQDVKQLAPIYNVFSIIALMPTYRRLCNLFDGWSTQLVISVLSSGTVLFALFTSQPMFVDGESFWQIYIAVSILPLLLTPRTPPVVDEWVEDVVKRSGLKQ